MKKEERGMVKYAPYQSLVEQSTYLARMRQRRQRVEKKSLFSDEAETINELLTAGDGGTLSITYWSDGFMHQEEGAIQKIDPFARVIYINGITIPLSALQHVERK